MDEGRDHRVPQLWDRPLKAVLFLLVFLHTPRIRRHEESELGLLYEMAPTGQLILDATRHILLANPAAYRIFQRPAGELSGLPLSELIAHGAEATLDQAFTMANRHGGTPPTAQIDILDGTGSSLSVEIVIGRFPEHAGPGYVVVLRDIREQVALVEALIERGAQLARSNRDLQEFTYIASHDLQEPLRMVASYTQLVAERYQGKLDPAADEFLGFAQEGAARMQRLIDDLVNYSRIDTRGQPFAPLSMDACLTDALRNLEVMIHEAGATIERSPLPSVEGDPVQLMQVLQNLISNAVKFHGTDPARVAVRGEDEGPTVLYSVSDNGIGIPEEYREKIFVIFQRLHRREEYPGTGVGLAVCKKIIDRHGGTIWVESTVGKGSVFRFRLPHRQPALPPPTDRPPVTPIEREAQQQAEDLITDRLKELV
ncbi:MAG: ATP-binding protein [Thermoplasmata archaeon]